MAQGYNLIDVLASPGSAITRNRYIESPIRAHVLVNSVDYSGLKAFDPPRGHDGAVAMIVSRDSAGSTVTAASLPKTLIYIWVDNDLSNDNGTTILRPVAVSNSTPGRWMQVQTIGGGSVGVGIVDPSAYIPGCVLYVNTVNGSLFYWDDAGSQWVKLIGP